MPEKIPGNSQGLSLTALRAKRARDKAMAMTTDRKDKKAENQRIGQRSDSDLHHRPDGSVVRVPIRKNRGNYGRGTKNE